MSSANINLPPQQLPFSRKTKEWRKKHLLWADSKTFFNYSLVRDTIMHKRVNFDLLNGKLHMHDMQLVLNPEGINASYIPDRIQHYPIMNSKLNVLRGEESKRVFDFKVVITNPNAISEIENNKKAEITSRLQQIVSNNSQSEDEYNQELQKMNDFFSYEWQDMREIRANALLNHYIKEYNMPLLFNSGIMDAMAVGEEVYQVDIVGGEPVVEKLNTLKLRVFKSGYSNRIEDADVIIYEDYWQPGRVIDTWYDVLSDKDIKYIESLPDQVGQGAVDSMDNIDDRKGFVDMNMVDETFNNQEFYFDPFGLFAPYQPTKIPYDLAGNLRVLRVYWKSKRKIKKVKSYNQETGEEEFNFYPETYEINKALGEEEWIFWINEAWEGTKIGDDIFVNMRPRLIQYNRLSNPSRCHFGIIGSIYNLNEAKPFSLVDMMKPYNYLYNVIHDRLNKAIAANWGAIMELDIAQVPKGWEIEKWMHYAKIHKIAIKDSFKEGNIGAATGKLAGNFANNSRGILMASDGNYIQQNINLLEFIKMEMAEVAGISKQREGQISNRETVGGVERANLQSSHITEWIFTVHEDIKRRVLEAFLETAKIALKGRSKKFQYILSDGSSKIMDIDGDEFAEADYGLVVSNDSNVQQLSGKLDMLAQAALQNQTLSFGTIMKLYTSSSLAEKQRTIEIDERAIQERNAKNQQAQLESNEKIQQANIELQEKKLALDEAKNIRDNETRLIIAQMSLDSASEDGINELEPSEENKEELMEKIRQFDAKLALDKEKLSFEKEKSKEELAIKRKSVNKKRANK